MDLQFVVDAERCVQCGECVADCPVGVLELEGLPRVVNGSACIGCQHCLAVCPTAALSILGANPDLAPDLKGAFPEFRQMDMLLRGRRSVRRYKKQNVQPELLRQLLDAAWNAPTGVNNLGVLFTVIDDMEHMEAFRAEVYARLDELVFGEKRVEHPAMSYLGWAAKQRRKSGADVIFRGAPHMLIASSASAGPCPKEDCLIALSNFDLIAQAAGVGTVWNGMLKWAVADILPGLREGLGIPEDHVIGYGMAFGLPDVRYHRTVLRGPARVNRAVWKGPA